jgi:hypothetical protein
VYTENIGENAMTSADSKWSEKLQTAIDETLQRKRSSGVFDAAGCACTVAEVLALEDPEQWALIRDQLAVESIAATISRRLQRMVDKTDSRQGVLALPEFQRVPQLIKVEGGVADIREVTLEQYRESEAELRARIKSYAYPRRSPLKLKRDKEQLSSMTKLDRRVAPLMAGALDSKMGVGMEAYERLGGRTVESRKARASKGGTAKSQRTKNQ